MHIVALVRSPTHVCARYRLEAYRPFLEQGGHSLELRSWGGGWFDGLNLRSAVRGADAVVLQRRLPPRWQLLQLRRATRLLIFDFDDAIFLRDSHDWRGPSCPRLQRRFARVVRAADCVLAGNAYLRDQARRSAQRDNVRLAPTRVDVLRYQPADHSRNDATLRLVWIGSSSTLRSLEQRRDLLEWLGKDVAGLNLHVICDRSLTLNHLPVKFRPWSAPTEATELASCDIGISWLPGDDWSRGKCGLKVLQYMAAGLPVIANPVGVQADLVRHGETGFLVDSPAGWLQALRQLGDSPDLRRRMGAAGRKRVESDFHLAQGAALWLDMLKTSRHLVAASPRI